MSVPPAIAHGRFGSGTCENCETEFTKARRNQRFCTYICGREWWRKQHVAKDYEETACVNCAQQFKPKRNSQVYCSSTCRKEFWKRESQEMRKAWNDDKAS